MTVDPPVISVMLAVPDAAAAARWYATGARRDGPVGPRVRRGALGRRGTVLPRSARGQPLGHRRRRWAAGPSASRCSSTTRTRSSRARWTRVRTATSTWSAPTRCRGARTGRAASSTRSATCGSWVTGRRCAPILAPRRPRPRDDVDAIHALRRSLEDWMAANGTVQWPQGSLPRERVAAQVDAGEWHVVRDDDGLVGHRPPAVVGPRLLGRRPHARGVRARPHGRPPRSRPRARHGAARLGRGPRARRRRRPVPPRLPDHQPRDPRATTRRTGSRRSGSATSPTSPARCWSSTCRCGWAFVAWRHDAAAADLSRTA